MSCFEYQCIKQNIQVYTSTVHTQQYVSRQYVFFWTYFKFYFKWKYFILYVTMCLQNSQCTSWMLYLNVLVQISLLFGPVGTVGTLELRLLSTGIFVVQEHTLAPGVGPAAARTQKNWTRLVLRRLRLYTYCRDITTPRRGGRHREVLTHAYHHKCWFQ